MRVPGIAVTGRYWPVISPIGGNPLPEPPDAATVVLSGAVVSEFGADNALAEVTPKGPAVVLDQWWDDGCASSWCV